MSPIVLHEVGMRDGLQMEKEPVPTPVKMAWIVGLMQSGADIIQVGSFVHPTKVPQMADTDLLFRELLALHPRPGHAVLSGLVLNEKGLERGLACGVEMFCMGVSASETHSMKNTGMPVAEATSRIIKTAQDADRAGKPVQVSVQSAFGCGFEGFVPPSRVLEIIRRYIDAGIGRVSLADTAGHATPDDVRRMFDAILNMDSGLECACHFHNTYGLALANAYAALQSGVTCIETSIAGLGGCPFTRIAGGNLCTEDFVHYLRRNQTRMDIDLDRLIQLAGEVAGFFHREMPGTVYKVGPIPSMEEGAA